VLGQRVKDATTESLLIVGTAGLVGAADYARNNLVKIKIALAFDAAGAGGAIADTALNRLVDGRVLLLALRCSCSPPRLRCCAAGPTHQAPAAIFRSCASRPPVSARAS
jgi:hypothetical protein